MYAKHKSELVHEPKYQPSRRFIHNDLAEQLVRTLWTDKIDAFRRSLWFNVTDTFNTKEQTVLKSVKDAFERENMQTQYSVLGYRVDLYFHDYKYAIVVDELGHNDESIDYERKELSCEFIRINKKLTKKYLIDKVSQRILELSFKSNHSIKSKCLKLIVKKNISYRIKDGTKKNNENDNSSIHRYCLGCKKHTNNLASTSVTITNKVLRQKWKCSVCLSEKSRFFKQRPYKKVVKYT